MMPEHIDDTRLMEEARHGDAKAFGELYDRYCRRVYSFAYVMLGNRSIAEEVTHEAFLVLIEHPERYQPDRGSVLTFLCAIARYKVYHFLRRRGYRVELENLDEAYLTELPDEDRPDPLTVLLKDELADKITGSIRKLSPLQREVIILREFQEMSYIEIAGVTGTDVGAVKLRLHRARRSLARLLAPYMNSLKELVL